MNNGHLLHCQNCRSEHGKHPVLGRMLVTGGFMIMRYHTGTTVINSSNITISCGCGFSYFIEGTVIQGTALLPV